MMTLVSSGTPGVSGCSAAGTIDSCEAVPRLLTSWWKGWQTYIFVEGVTKLRLGVGGRQTYIQGEGRGRKTVSPFLIIPSSSAGAMYPPASHIGHKMVLWQLVHLVGGSSYITILCHRMSFFSSSVHLSALVTFVELNSTLLCSAAPGGVWFLPAPPPRTDVSPRAISLPRSRLPGG